MLRSRSGYLNTLYIYLDDAGDCHLQKPYKMFASHERYTYQLDPSSKTFSHATLSLNQLRLIAAESSRESQRQSCEGDRLPMIIHRAHSRFRTKSHVVESRAKKVEEWYRRLGEYPPKTRLTSTIRVKIGFPWPKQKSRTYGTP